MIRIRNIGYVAYKFGHIKYFTIFFNFQREGQAKGAPLNTPLVTLRLAMQGPYVRVAFCPGAVPFKAFKLIYLFLV